MVENILGKGDDGGNYQHFLVSPKMFSKAFSGSLKVGIVWEKVKGF